MSKSTIAGIQFTLRDSKQIEAHSTVNITSYDMYTNNNPTPGGVFDLRLGTFLREMKCRVCKNTKGKCLGHVGRIDLSYPVINPFGVKEYRKWLKVICHKCGGSVSSTNTSVGTNSDKLTAMAGVTRTKNKNCANCRAVHPIIKQHSVEKLALEAVFLNDKGLLVDKYVIYPHMAHDIFSRVTPETVASYGRRPENHPLSTVLYTVTAPSNIIRPDVRQTGDDKTNNNDITNMMIVMLKKNAEFPNPIPEVISPDTLGPKIWAFNNLYFEMIRAGGKETPSISGRFKGKTGRFRATILGKQVRRIARATIIGDPTLRLDELRISQKFAKTIYIEETVQEYNRNRLLILLQNGPNRYPGAIAIVKKSGGLFDVNPNTDFSTLESGDIVRRHVLAGDFTYFNRQPSFMPSNLSGFRVTIASDPEDLTIGMSVTIVKMFNADFDGDAMNLIFAANPAGMAEIETMGWMGNNIIHFSTARMLVGQVQDSTIGLAELTRDDVRFDKYHACMLFARATEMPRLNEVFSGKTATITGRDCISLILKKTPINSSCSATWYNQTFIPSVKYRPGEITTVIKNGKHISGVLDGATIGTAATSIYQIIANDYGNQRAIQAVFDMQQVAIHFMKMRGYTVSVEDILVPDEARQKIDMITAEAITRSELIIEQLIRREILPPMGVTVREHYEVMQSNALKNYDGYIDVLLQHINHDTNNLFKLAAFGSKGSINNMANIVSAVGQKTLNGRRMPKKFGYERTLPCFRRFDLSPEANGYIQNSYIVGMNPAEMAFAGMCSRWALIIKALATSIGGQMSRDAIKCMESMYIDYFRHLKQRERVIAFAYGGDNLDPRKIENLKIPTVNISEAAFKEKYFNEALPAEFEAMREDREKYRRVFLGLESVCTNEPYKDARQLAVNITRIIDNVLNGSGGPGVSPSGSTRQDLAELAEDVRKFCEELPYTYYNDDWMRAGMPASATSKSVTWLAAMQVRANLCSRELARRGVSREQLRLILGIVRLNYAKALVDPGAAVGMLAAMGFSEPLMQQMMDAHRQSASGGSSISGAKRAKEVFNVRDTEAMDAPEMILQFEPKIAENKTEIQKISNTLEVLRFETFISGQPLIFAERYGRPIHPAYAHESEMIADFQDKNPLLTPPENLTSFCIRYELDKTQLILKNMEIEHIVVKLKSTNTDLFIAYTPKNAPRVILRVYVRASHFKVTPKKSDIEALDESIQGMVLRGVPGIIRAAPVKLVRHKILEDGSVVPNTNCWGIKTAGTNIPAGLFVPGVVRELVFSNSIQEIYEMFGIEAARIIIINECRRMLPECNYRHYDTYASLITQKGYPTTISRTGTKEREPDDILLNMGYSNPADYLETAVSRGIYNEVSGVSSSLAVGTVPRIGTNYTRMEVNEAFIRENASSANQEFDELFDA